MVSIGDLLVIVAASAGLLRAVRDVTLKGKRVPVGPLKNNLLMERILRRNWIWGKEREEQRG